MTNLIPDINLKTVINNYLSRDYEKDITKSEFNYCCSRLVKYD